MTTSFVIELGRDTIFTALKVVGPIMLVGFVVGMSVSIIQSIMQIQEMTLAFVPKLIAIGASMIVFGSYMIRQLMMFTEKIFGNLDKLIQP